jgi:hypothetical protein
MKQEYENRIYNDFPEFFEAVKSEKEGDCHTPQYLFGIEVGDGWFDLIYKLFSDLKKATIKNVVAYIGILPKDHYPQIFQIKEKLGGLCFYIDNATDEQYKLISKAQSDSYHICEICGKKGKLRRVDDWLLTECKQCLIKYLNRKNLSYWHYLYHINKYKAKNLKWKLKMQATYRLKRYSGLWLGYLKKLL